MVIHPNHNIMGAVELIKLIWIFSLFLQINIKMTCHFIYSRDNSHIELVYEIN